MIYQGHQQKYKLWGVAGSKISDNIAHTIFFCSYK